MSPELVLGAALALASLAYVLYPLIDRRGAGMGVGPRSTREPPPPVGAPLRDVTDEEIESAIRSYRASRPGGRGCPVCGPRPEEDAVYCSSCGRRVDGGAEG